MIRAAGNRDGVEFLFVGLTKEEVKSVAGQGIVINLIDLVGRFDRLPDALLLVVRDTQDQLLHELKTKGGPLPAIDPPLSKT